MNIPQITVAVERSNAQIAALIESHDQLGPKHIESNLLSIQSRLCDAEVLLTELNGGGVWQHLKKLIVSRCAMRFQLPGYY